MIPTEISIRYYVQNYGETRAAIGRNDANKWKVFNMSNKTIDEHQKDKERILELIKCYMDSKFITDRQKLDFFDTIINKLSDCKKEIEKINTPQLPNVGDNYPRYPGSPEDALEWLRIHWGKYLKYFIADKNYLFQDQLWKLDKKLMSALTSNRRYRNHMELIGIKIRDIVPKKSERITNDINRINNDPSAKETIRSYCTGIKRKSVLNSPKK